MSSIPLTFAYRAQGLDGQPLSGTIDAGSADQARERLESLRLRVLELEPAAGSKRTSALRGEDFVTFNQQLAQLAATGLPLEQGLRLIAQDMRRGKVANTVRQIADELEKGEPLGEAFEKRKGQFPPAYGRLIQAGVATNNLSGMLLNLSEYQRTLARLRAAIWRATAYPLTVFIALCLVVAFLGEWVLPQFQNVFGMWGTKLPAITQFMLDYSRVMSVIAIGAAGVIILMLIIWRILRLMGRENGIRDAVGLRLPLIGPVLKRSVISRWCDAVKLGVVGGMDLPAAMRTGADAVGSPRLGRDVEKLAARMEAGEAIDLGERLSLIPGTVTASIELSSRQGGLQETLATLSRMYQQQAQAKVGLIPAVLTPLLLALLTGIIGFIILAMFMPFATLLRSIS
jgi:type IV pilus assembly protein PilC